MKLTATLALAALAPASGFTAGVPAPAALTRMMADGAQSADASLAVAPAGGASGPGNGWAIGDISPDGKLTQRVEGQTRKTWAFNDFSKDRVQSRSRPRAAP